MGDYYIDGVAFPAEEIVLEFAEPVVFRRVIPYWKLSRWFRSSRNWVHFKAIMITAGIPTCFVNAADIGYKGTELQVDVTTMLKH